MSMIAKAKADEMQYCILLSPVMLKNSFSNSMGNMRTFGSVERIWSLVWGRD